jgi:hypothetical protein
MQVAQVWEADRFKVEMHVMEVLSSTCFSSTSIRLWLVVRLWMLSTALD